MTPVEWIIIIIVTIAITAAAAGLSYALAPKPDIEDVEPSGLGDYNFPTNLESRYIPVVWGTTRIDGQNVVWYGDFSAKELDTGGKVVAFEYSLGLDLALCWGPIDSISEITIDDGPILKAGETTGVHYNPISRQHILDPITGYPQTTSGDRYFTFLDRSFFGGGKRGGGINGSATFYYGTDNQSASNYISSVELRDGATVNIGGQPVSTGLLVPRYPEVCHLVWEGGNLGEAATLQQWRLTVHRYPTSLTAAYSKVAADPVSGQGDANPAHVIYEILTDTNWGLSIPPDLIDTASFIAVAEKCYTENNGFSMTVDSAKQAKTVIDNILTQINAMLVQNEEGLFDLRLLRKTYRTTDNAVLDYDGNVVGTETIPVVTESSIIKMKSASRQSWDETFNVVQVKYNDRLDNFKETIATAHDLGNMAIQNGKRRVKQVSAPGVRTPTAAAVVAQRNLVSHAYPITSIDIEVSREFSGLRPSDIVEVNHPDFGLESFYMRILEVGLPKDTDGNVILKGIRDVFDEPAFDQVMHIGGDSSSATLQTGDAAEPTVVKLTGLPYFYHEYYNVGPLCHTWHVVGRPDAVTSATQPFVANALAAGVWDSTADPAVTPYTGKVVAHIDDLWQDRSYAQRYLRDSNATSNNACGPYGNDPGPNTNPIRSHTNFANASVTFMNEGYCENLFYLRNLKNAAKNYEGPYGSIWVKDVANIEALVSSITSDQIKYHGYGLALCRPKWANGDSRFDEIIAFKEAYTLKVSIVVPKGRFDTVIDINDQYVEALSRSNLEHVVVEPYTILVLDGIYRGLMDTGIQVINSDSDIIFLSSGDILYDQVGESLTNLQSGGGGTWNSAYDVTYRHQMFSVGDITDLDQMTDYTATAQERARKVLPIPPKSVQLAGASVSGGGLDALDDLWGYCYYDNGEWQGYYTTGNNGRGGFTRSPNFEYRWKHQDVYNDATYTDNMIWWYNEFSATAPSGQRSVLTLNLLEDQNGSAANDTERFRHAIARFKEGWMPTTPALRYADKDDPAVTVHGFRATTAVEIPHDGSSTSNTVNVQTTLQTADPTISFTAGNIYYVEIWIQSHDHSAGLKEESYGAQRVMYEFQAA